MSTKIYIFQEREQMKESLANNWSSMLHTGYEQEFFHGCINYLIAVVSAAVQQVSYKVDLQVLC